MIRKKELIESFAPGQHEVIAAGGNRRTFTEEEKGKVVVEYWEKVAENPNMEKEMKGTNFFSR